MTRKLYGGYGLTEMRTYAREYKIRGRSKMDGDELLTALRAYWNARRIEQERAVISAATVGAVLRHKETGDLVRVVGEVGPRSGDNDALCFKAEYIEIVDPHDLTGGWTGRGVELARYHNESNQRADEAGFLSHSVHALWQYEAVERLVKHRDIARTTFRVVAESDSKLCIIPTDSSTEGRWVSATSVIEVAA